MPLKEAPPVELGEIKKSPTVYFIVIAIIILAVIWFVSDRVQGGPEESAESLTAEEVEATLNSDAVIVHD